MIFVHLSQRRFDARETLAGDKVLLVFEISFPLPGEHTKARNEMLVCCLNMTLNDNSTQWHKRTSLVEISLQPNDPSYYSRRRERLGQRHITRINIRLTSRGPAYLVPSACIIMSISSSHRARAYIISGNSLFSDNEKNAAQTYSHTKRDMIIGKRLQYCSRCLALGFVCVRNLCYCCTPWARIV